MIRFFYIQNKKKRKCLLKIFFFTFFIISIVTSSVFSYAQEYNEARNAIENLASEIRMNVGAVGQVLSEAMYANHGQMEKWQKLDEKMSELGSSIDKNLAEITKNLSIIRQVDPNYNNPYIGVYNIFQGHLNQAMEKKKQLLDMAKGENTKLDKINQMIAKINDDILNASKGLVGATLEGFMPDEISLAGEASVIVLGAYFGPPGIAAAGLAWAATGTFNSMINLYYNTKTLADQAKVLNNMRQGLLTRKSELEKNIRTLTDGAKEMEQIERILDKHERTMNGYKEKIVRAIEGWTEQEKQAHEKRKQELEKKIKEQIEQQKNYPSEIALCNGQKIVLNPNEYIGEVNSMISQVESYVKGIEDGGDPDNFYSFIVDWNNKMVENYKKAYENYKKAWENYNNTAYNCARSVDWGKEGAWQRYCSCVISSDTARANAWKEYSKVSTIYYKVYNFFYLFNERIRNATESRTREFYNAYNMWIEKINTIEAKRYSAISKVPYWINQWKDRAERVDKEVDDALNFWNVDEVRKNLLDTAEYLKELNKTVKEAEKEYEKINSEQFGISNQAKSELANILNKWSRLIGYYWNMPYLTSIYSGEKAEFTPHSPEVEKGIKRLEEDIKERFKVKDAENIINAKKIDLLSIAAIYENKAKELTFYSDWIETYRFRRASAIGVLSRISQEKTKRAFFAPIEQDRLEKELASPPWSAISSEVDKVISISKEDYNKTYMRFWGPFEKLTPWRKLYAAQQLLLMKLENEARYYVQIRASGGFQPVSENLMRPLEDSWKKLRQICERYDSLAKQVINEIGKSPEEVTKAALPVFETYNKMPAISKRAVQEEHYRFSGAYNNLLNYLNGKLDAIRTTLEPPTNDVAIRLDDLILKYQEHLAKWKKAQEEAQRLFEEQQRRFAEEQKRREEEERRRAEMSINAVKELYSKFKNAYESKNDALLVSLLSRNWSATDGTTISEIQRNLRNSFRVFDELKWNIQNLNIQPQKDDSNTYQVSYDITITGRIYKRNIKHEEKSKVVEKVIVDKNGKAYIEATLEGRFWTIN